MSVIVAGAGPVGLVAALRLAQLGVDVAVFERREALSRASRASTIHSPTLSAFETLGIVGAGQQRGHRVDRIHYYRVGHGLFADFDLSLLANDTPYPQRLHWEQADIAAELVAKLSTHSNARMAFGQDVTAVEQDANGVSVRVESAGTTRTARADYLLATDGARSRVRDDLGIDFEGEGYGHRVLRVMTSRDLSELIPGCASVAYLFDGADSCSLLRMPDCWRIIFRIAPDETDAAALEEATIRRRLARFIPGGADLPIVSTDIYGVERRVAASFRAGRILIAGDAAHITNTRGGMNMNAGIADAMAAAEALAIGTETALATYAAERRRIAVEKLLPRTDRTVAGGDAWLEHVRATAADPERARTFLLGSSMLDMTTSIAEAAAEPP